MSRKSCVYKHFQENETFFECAVEENGKVCSKTIPKLKCGSTAGNLKRHLTRHHKEMALEVTEEESEMKDKKRKREESQRPIDSLLPKKKRSCNN